MNPILGVRFIFDKPFFLSKYVTILVVTENNEILENPVSFSFVCSQIQPVGELNVRNYDANDCIVVRQVFGLQYNGTLYGTNDFKTMMDWYRYRNTECVPCRQNICCVLTYNGCLVTYKGQTIYTQNVN